MSCYYQAGIILHLSQPCVHYGREFSDWLTLVLWAWILRGRHQGMRLRNRLDGEQLYRIINSLFDWVATEHDEIIHDTVTWNHRYSAFIPPRAPLVYEYHVISLIRTELQCRFSVASYSRWLNYVPRKMPDVRSCYTRFTNAPINVRMLRHMYTRILRLMYAKMLARSLWKAKT